MYSTVTKRYVTIGMVHVRNDRVNTSFCHFCHINIYPDDRDVAQAEIVAVQVDLLWYIIIIQDGSMITTLQGVQYVARLMVYLITSTPASAS